MSTIIIYTTKHGSTQTCAGILALKMDGKVTMVNIKTDDIPCLNCADNIVVGGPIYVGKIQKNITRFLEENRELLLSKKLGLFICCEAEEEDAREQLENAFSEELREHAVAVENFGGEIRWDDLGLLEKAAVKAVMKQSESSSDIDTEAIERMARALE